MTPNEINEAIASSLGWTNIVVIVHDGMGMAQKMRTGDWTTPDKKHRLMLPNYYSSLDACTEFESSLTQQECWNYDTELYCCDCGFAWKATAAQRCESYLKIKGLWK